MLNEEIARLTGTLKFNVEARPLVAFEKKLNGVMSLLREFSTIANKKFTVKVSLDSRSLRAQIDKATKAKISLNNIDISQEALHAQGKRIQEYLDKTPIRLSNVKVDISKLNEQRKFVKTWLGQMQIDLPIKLGIAAMETELRREVKAIGARTPIKLAVHINANALEQKLRSAMKRAQKGMQALKIRVAEPEVRLKVDKQHLIAEIRAAISSTDFDIRVGARRNGGGAGGRGEGGRGGRNQVDRGLSSAMGFARGALPGLGAAFAVSQMNDISQKVTAAQNSLEAVSGSEENFKSNKGFLENMTKEMGLNFRDIAPQFSSIYQSAAPSIGRQGTQDMFRGIMKYGTVHGLDKEAMKGSTVALSQMFGKDKIQSEEARQQFSERMPNGMAMLAQAAFNAKQTKSNSVKDFGELMKAGNADPKKILPELGRLMEAAAMHNDAYAKSLETTRVAQGRMNRQFEQSVMIFAGGGFDKGLAGFFNNLANAMERAAPLTEALGKAFEIIIQPLNAIITLIGDLGEAWPKLSEALGVSKKALATFATAVAVFMLPFGGFIIAIAAAAMVLEDLVTYFKGGDSVFGRMVKDIPGAQGEVDKLTQAFEHLKDSFKNIGEAFDGLKDSESFKYIGEAFDGLKSKYTEVFGTVETENPFVLMLRVVSEQVDKIASGLDRIAALLRGDLAGAFGKLPGLKEIMIDNNPLFAPARFFAPKIANVLGQGLDSVKGWATGGWGHSGGMPTQPGGQSGVQQGGASAPAPNITIPSITLQVQAPAGVADPKQHAEQMAPHIQDITTKALRDAFGAARAQQAERQ